MRIFSQRIPSLERRCDKRSRDLECTNLRKDPSQNVKVSQINKQPTWKTPVPSGKDRHGDPRERQGQRHKDFGTPEPDQCCRSSTAGNQHLAAVDLICPGSNWNYHRVVENVSTWQMDRGLALSS